jgi:hypothetical protein
MAFSQSVKDDALKRSGGQCECTRQHPGRTEAPHHGGRCSNKFGRWHAHHTTAGGPDTLSNCEALCVPCHELTQTYGG